MEQARVSLRLLEMKIEMKMNEINCPHGGNT